MTTDKTIDSSKVPQLIVQLPDGKEVHHPILGAEITVGRDPTNRICLSDNFVSKFHAKLLVSSHSMNVVDLGSANKTRVNGKPIQQETVRFGDEIQFAGVKCRLVAPPSQRGEKPAAGAKMPAPPPPPVQPPAPPERAATPPPAPVTPKAPPADKKKTVPVPGRAPGPPPVTANPMTKLYIIGGILIGIALVLGILLRVLLVPSGEPGEAENQESTATTSAPAGEPVTTTTAGGGTTSVVASPPVGSGGGESVEHYFDQALSYLDAGRLKEARTSFLRVLELDPQNSRAKTRLSLLEEEIDRKAEQHFDNARQAFNFLRYEEAIAEWEMFMYLVDSSDSRYAEAEQGIAQARAKLR